MPSDHAGRFGVLLTVAYDGAPFAGFARQPGQRTVAGALLEAVQSVDPTVAEVRGASRTDAGVHARGQRVAFDADKLLPPRAWALAVGRHLPPSIGVRAAAEVPPGFHPRFAARFKRYRYLVLASPTRDPHAEGRAWRVDGLASAAPLALMRRELAAAVGRHDFAAFRSSQDPRSDTTRTIHAAIVSPLERAALYAPGCVSPNHARCEPADVLALDVVGDGFLHRMVRVLVGTAVDVARGRLPLGATSRALASGDRRHAGVTAPADGLYLEHIELSGEPRQSWPPGG